MTKGRQRQKSEYGRQLEEKQGLKETYGLREQQFRRYFREGGNPDLIMKLLEQRLDNVTFRCGFASTRKFARQLVSHGHIQVNQKNVDLPSHRVKVGDSIRIHPGSLKIVAFQDLTLTLKKYEPPTWIELDKTALQAKIVKNPIVDDPIIMASVKPIIEFYRR